MVKNIDKIQIHLLSNDDTIFSRLFPKAELVQNDQLKSGLYFNIKDDSVTFEYGVNLSVTEK